MSQALKDRVAIVVGSSSGIGRATAVAFANVGARVVLAARSADQLEALASEIGENALSCPTDVQDAAAVDGLIQTALDRFERIDILVYATGTNIPERSLEVLTNETWDMMIRTNLTGAFYCTKAVVPAMRRQQEGLIIYISTVAVQMPDLSADFLPGVQAWTGRSGLTLRSRRSRTMASAPRSFSLG